MVASVIDGETLKLTDGRTVRLIGAKAPMPPLGWRGEDPWPFVDEAKEALAALAANRPVELRPGGSRLDRYGHLLAQVFVVTGGTRLWLQDAHRRGTRPRLFLPGQSRLRNGASGARSRSQSQSRRLELIALSGGEPSRRETLGTPYTFL